MLLQLLLHLPAHVGLFLGNLQVLGGHPLFQIEDVLTVLVDGPVEQLDLLLQLPYRLLHLSAPAQLVLQLAVLALELL